LCFFCIWGRSQFGGAVTAQVLDARIEAPICLQPNGCEANILATAQESAKRTSKSKENKEHAGIENDGRCPNDEPSWARMDDLSDGPSALERLKDALASGKPFSLHRSTGKVLVQASESGRDRQYVAVCTVQIVKGVSGPPFDCETVAIITPSLILLRKMQHRMLCDTMATSRETGAIDITYSVKTEIPITRFIPPLTHLLENDLGLTTEMDVDKDQAGEIKRITYRSAAAFRVSNILPGTWRESISLDLHLWANAHGFDVNAITVPMVNRLNTGSLTSYSVPDDLQRKTYATAFDKQIGGAITRACTSVDRTDNKTLTCK
jgi:hypothetical protein